LLSIDPEPFGLERLDLSSSAVSSEPNGRQAGHPPSLLRATVRQAKEKAVEKGIRDSRLFTDFCLRLFSVMYLLGKIK
jgi:hypothetical protein